METESVPKQSFFDDEDTTIKFDLHRPLQKNFRDLSMPFILKSYFQYKVVPEGNAGEGIFMLYNKTLARAKNESDLSVDSVLDLSHSRAKYIRPTEEGGKYGFGVSKNSTTLEFYSSDKQTIDNWYQMLKKICVLNTFHDDYKAIKMIGRGSFAKVYLVESKTTGTSYAVKAFTKDAMAVSNKANAKPSMLNEIEIMRELDHENIIKLFEVYETEKSIYLVLELITGKSLYDFFKKATFKEEVSATKIINMTRSLLDALAYMASKGIMHRDLKPDNILLEKNEKVKIVDFGLATFVDVPHYIFKKCGTPGYIAPEIFKYEEMQPKTHYDHRCDVFSVGCLFHFMLFHAPLFDGATAADILKLNKKFDAEYPVYNKIKNEINDPNSKISKDGLRLLYEMIEFDHKARMTASQALDHAYFTPMPMGMHKGTGPNEFVIDALSKYNQNDVYSPASPLKPKIRSQDQSYSPHTPLTPLTPLRLDTAGETESPLLPKKERYVREDSLYLDLGKPEITGRTDTITGGSTNSSLVLTSKAECINNVGTNPGNSIFKKESQCTNTNALTNSASKAKVKPTTSQQALMKAAIFRNMQKNNSEGYREEDVIRSKMEEYKAEQAKTPSPQKENYVEQGEMGNEHGMSYGGRDKENDNEVLEEVGYENAEVSTNVDRINLATQGKHPSKPNVVKTRRFHPFAQNTLLIPKNDMQGE